MRKLWFKNKDKFIIAITLMTILFISIKYLSYNIQKVEKKFLSESVIFFSGQPTPLITFSSNCLYNFKDVNVFSKKKRFRLPVEILSEVILNGTRNMNVTVNECFLKHILYLGDYKNNSYCFKNISENLYKNKSFLTLLSKHYFLNSLNLYNKLILYADFIGLYYELKKSTLVIKPLLTLKNQNVVLNGKNFISCMDVVNNRAFLLRINDYLINETIHKIKKVISNIYINLHRIFPLYIFKNVIWVSIEESVKLSICKNHLTMRIDFFSRILKTIHASYKKSSNISFSINIYLLKEYAFIKYKYLILHKFYMLNHTICFHKISTLYFLSVLLILISLFAKQFSLFRTVSKILGLTLTLNSIFMIIKAYLYALTPLTNLYETVIFVCVLFSLFLIIKNNNFVFYNFSKITIILLGFTINLVQSESLRSLEIISGILKANIWLSTHVVFMSIGYSICLGMSYLSNIQIISYLKIKMIQKIFVKKKYAYRINYLMIQVSFFFMLTGTMLGSIWANNAWGRLWEWDPKENGALILISLLLIHVHQFKSFVFIKKILFSEVFLNIWVFISWFAINLLGVGLHSYGFLNNLFFTLVFFFLYSMYNMILFFNLLKLITKKY